MVNGSFQKDKKKKKWNQKLFYSEILS
jgi:hypothetical protein